MSEQHSPKKQRKPGTSIVVAGLAGLSALYLLNPGFGVFDIIPDNLPVVGNLDEAAATALLISCFAYFGFDVTKLIHLLVALFRGEARPTKVRPDSPETIDIETEER